MLWAIRHTMVGLALLSVLLLFSTSAWAAPPYNSKRVKRASLFVTEGVVEVNGIPNTVTSYNWTMPGPVLRFRPGDVVVVNVTNLMPARNTTVHWHGLSQRLTPFSDGTPLSQWPIAPGHWFEYQMELTKEDIGTRFYHDHMGLQAITSNGAFIVEDPNPPYEYDEDRIMMVQDFYYKKDTEMQEQLTVPGEWKWIGNPNITLINGKGMTNTFEGEPHIVDVDFDKKYLFRWIGGQALMYYSIGFIDHEQTLVEVEGTWIKPWKGDGVIELGPGNRLGSIVKTKSADEVKQDGKNGCYWIRIESAFRKPSVNNWALLRYPGGCQSVPKPPAKDGNNTLSILRTSQVGWNSAEIEPYHDLKPLTDDMVTERFVVDARQILTQGNKTKPTGIAWVGAEDDVYTEAFPSMPYLVQLYRKAWGAPSLERADHPAPGYQKGYDSLANSFVTTAPRVIDVVILNNASFLQNTEIHTWHFHGAKFRHIASGLGNFTQHAFDASRAKGYGNPVPRDMMTVWPGPGAAYLNETLPTGSSGGWSVFRYEVSSGFPGVWPLHCHLLPHLVMGMLTTITIDPERFVERLLAYPDGNLLRFGKNVLSDFSVRTQEGKEHRKAKWVGGEDHGSVPVSPGGGATTQRRRAQSMHS